MDPNFQFNLDRQRAKVGRHAAMYSSGVAELLAQGIVREDRRTGMFVASKPLCSASGQATYDPAEFARLFAQPESPKRGWITETAWQALAWVVSRKPVADALIRIAQRTPYFPLYHREDGSLYMDRWWLFNSISTVDGAYVIKHPRIPLMIRVHHIATKDWTRDHHSHPWHHARTIVLRGWYWESRHVAYLENGETRRFERRVRGDTATLDHSTYHTIFDVSEGGAWTLFFTWEKAGSWGFQTRSRGHVGWREYIGVPEGDDEYNAQRPAP